MRLAVRERLLAPVQLRQLTVDVLLFREDALLDLDDLGAPLAELFLDVGPKLDRLLARFDLSLSPEPVSSPA